MYTLYDSFTLTGQYNIKTWQQQGHSWAAYSHYRQPATHGLYVPYTILNLVIQGEKRMYDSTQVHHLRAGDIFLIPPGSLLCSEILHPEKDYASINLVLPEDQLNHSLASVRSHLNGRTKSSMLLSEGPQWNRLGKQLLYRFRDEQETGPPDYHHIIDQVLHLLKKEPSPVQQALATALRYPVPEMVPQLCAGLHEVRLLEEVAAMGFMSTATLKRRFRQAYQCSPMQWIWEKRLQMAAFLLRTTGQPVPEIAYSTGFEDVTHFYRQFRKCFGVTPAQWRRHETELSSK